MIASVLGLHHVTAIAGDPQANVDFYAGVLGLRLVKRTVNFDDPETYHFYYGDEWGHPGTLLTFFPWSRAPRGRAGLRQVGVTSFAVVPESIAYWEGRLAERGVVAQRIAPRFNETGLAFTDPDGLAIEIVGHPTAAASLAWTGGGVPAQHAIRGFHAVTIPVSLLEPTAQTLTDVLGFRSADQSATRIRLASGSGGPGTFVDIELAPATPRGAMGVGTVHHVAFRVADDEAQRLLRDDVATAGLHPTPVVDRQYFRSVYFHEPGGVLFELATDPPGMEIDEPVGALGQRLMLPPQYEPYRAELERTLPPIVLPAAEVTSER